MTHDTELIVFGERLFLKEGQATERDCTAFDRVTVKFRITKDGVGAPYAPFVLSNSRWIRVDARTPSTGRNV